MLHFAGLGFDGVRSMSVISGLPARQSATRLLRRIMPVGRSQTARYRRSQSSSRTSSRRRRATNCATPLRQLTTGRAGEISVGACRRRRCQRAINDAAGRPADRNAAVRKHDIYTAFGVPPIMGGDNEKTTSWGTGIEQITIGFVRYTLKPHLVRWEEELNRKLFRRAGPFVEFEISGLLRGDAKAQADYYKAALGGPGSGPAGCRSTKSGPYRTGANRRRGQTFLP